MNYVSLLKDAPDQITPGMSACQGCGGELILRRVMQVAGKNTIVAIPPGCLAGAGVVGWNYANGQKTPVHITLLDNTAAFLSGLSRMYERKGRSDVNIVAVAGDGATADCGFQSLSAAAERGEKMLYICYDNEGYMNTGISAARRRRWGPARRRRLWAAKSAVRNSSRSMCPSSWLCIRSNTVLRPRRPI